VTRRQGPSPRETHHPPRTSFLRPPASGLKPAFALALLAGGGCLGAGDAPAYIELYNEVVCYVNSVPISKRDVESRIDPLIVAKLNAFRDRMMAQNRWDDKAQEQYNELYLPDFRKELRQLVKEKLMLQEAKEQALELDKVEYKKRCDERTQQLKDAGLLGRKGYHLHEIQEHMSEQMLLEGFAGQLVTALDLPTRPEVEAYYKEHPAEFQRAAGVKLRVVRVDRAKTDSLGRTVPVEGALDEAENLRKDVVEYGRNFTDLARERSDDLQARARGGLLLGRDGDAYVPVDENRALAPVLRQLKVGQVSEVFAWDDRSWAFVLLEERRPAGSRPLDAELYQKIYDQLLHATIKKREDEWFRKALQRSLVLDGKPNPQPIPPRFFFPDDPTLATEDKPQAGSAAGKQAPPAPPKGERKF
jgi:hypothetical protein